MDNEFAKVAFEMLHAYIDALCMSRIIEWCRLRTIHPGFEGFEDTSHTQPAVWYRFIFFFFIVLNVGNRYQIFRFHNFGFLFHNESVAYEVGTETD